METLCMEYHALITPTVQTVEAPTHRQAEILAKGKYYSLL